MNKNNNDRMKNTLPYAILIGVIAVILLIFTFQGDKVNTLKTGELLDYLRNEEVVSLTITPNSNENVYYVEGKLKDYKESESFKAKIISEDITAITDYVKEQEIKEYDTNSDPGSSTILYIVVNVLPFVLMIVLGYILIKRLAMSNKNSVDFGRSRARLSSDSDKKNFNRRKRRSQRIN